MSLTMNKHKSMGVGMYFSNAGDIANWFRPRG